MTGVRPATFQKSHSKMYGKETQMETMDEILNLLKQGRYLEARPMLEDLVTKKPKDTVILYNLGMLYTELGNPEAAVKTLKKCIEYDPDHSNALVAIGYALYCLSNLDDAKGYLLDALKKDPDNPYAFRNLAAIFAKFRDWEKALYYFKKADELLPDDPRILYGLGLTYGSMGDTDSADTALKRVVALPGVSEDFKELARTELTKMAVAGVREVGFRPDVMFYCVAALKLFKGMTITEIQTLSTEIALKGRQGLDINNPDRKYELSCLPGKFSGLQLVTYMYVGFRQFAPELDTGVDFSAELLEAQKLGESGDIR